MNSLDSYKVIGILEKKGLKKVETIEEADLILLNTCYVRQHTENKILAKIESFKNKKNKILGILGCMTMVKKDFLIKNFPQIDFILGTENLKFFLEKTLKKFLQDENTNASQEDFKNIKHPSNIKAYVSIMQGCNNFCSYCIVPYTRGREISKDHKKIIQEIKYLKNKGYKEIILLGQNVNSYQDKNIKFTDLLYLLDKTNIDRVRFLTSHPKDITKDLIYAIRDLKSVCEFVHFPIQSGSSKILKKMNRGYTKEEYLEKVNLLKSTIPNVAIGTDIILGFCSETEKDFLETIDIFKKVEFALAFIHPYTPREHTASYHFKDDIPMKTKQKRVHMLLELYKKILLKNSKKFLNKKYEVLVERFNKDKIHLKAKTGCNKKVIFKGNKNMIGSFQEVKFIDYKHQTFIATI